MVPFLNHFLALALFKSYIGMILSIILNFFFQNNSILIGIKSERKMRICFLYGLYRKLISRSSQHRRENFLSYVAK